MSFPTLKHTPAPWVEETEETYDDDDSVRKTGWITNAAGDRSVVEYAGCGSHHAKWHEDDLRLVLAAPDLLAALLAARDNMEELGIDTNSTPAAMEQVKAAIAKATGWPR